jgi:DNA-binding NarL/FixJ family response regulator
VRQATDLETATSLLTERPARVTVCGSELGDDDVGTLVRRLGAAGSQSVVVLAPVVAEQELLAALEAGALGYVSRDSSLDRLVYDIQGALRGEACLPRDKLAPVLRLLIDRRREEDELSERLGRLSRREREVLDHLSTGATNEQIAGMLFLSQATVRTHVQNILTKLGVHSRLEAIALVHQTSVRR